jgi:membrane protease YdiL (CAAX protease family)
MSLRRLFEASPLIAALAFEGLLIPLALGLALLFGMEPWADFHASPAMLLAALAATVPPLAALALTIRLHPAWLQQIDGMLRDLVGMLFRGHGRIAVILVAALAGLGEELLFRGVIQVWLVEFGGPVPGLVLASLIFGLAHYVTNAYFVAASLMGLYLGSLFQFSGNLLVPSLVHALYDWIAIEYLLRQRPTSSTDESSD